MKGGVVVGSNPQAISLLYIVGLFAILYFLMIRPQQQRQKKHNEMVKSIKQNDKVITIGGIHGTVVRVMDRSIILEVADKVRMELLKTAVSQIVEQQEDEEPDDK
ncbi:MAG: preprotein translocase subunit YajC [Peptococcaceae bacterium]|nr:preprotein translocase subunit YajC [Peptococcaceae bacterium]